MENFQVAEHIKTLKGWYPWRGHGSSTLLPTYLPYVCFSIWLLPSCILSSKLVIANKARM